MNAEKVETANGSRTENTCELKRQSKQMCK